VRPIDFYVTAAQIIPVLLLVLAVELRAFNSGNAGRLNLRRRYDELGALALIVATELRVFRVIQTGRPGHVLGIPDSGLVWFTIGLEFAIIGAAALAPRRTTGAEQAEQR
jgi:hypothetical protein